MKIGNIIYEDELVNHKMVEYINYFKGDDFYPLKESIADLPTLVVGWNFLKKLEPNLRINILKHKIEKNKFYWEFSFNENKSSHVSGVNSFVEHVPEFYFSSRYKYVNLDPVFYQIRDENEIFYVLPKDIIKIYCFKDKMLYVLSSENIIYGFDLNMYSFFKFNIDNIILRFKEISFASFIDEKGEIYEKYYKIFPNFQFLKRYLVALV